MQERDKSGALVYLNYTGVVDITPELGKILGEGADAKSTGFGNSCMIPLLHARVRALADSRSH